MRCKEQKRLLQGVWNSPIHKTHCDPRLTNISSRRALPLIVSISPTSMAEMLAIYYYRTYFGQCSVQGFCAKDQIGLRASSGVPNRIGGPQQTTAESQCYCANKVASGGYTDPGTPDHHLLHRRPIVYAPAPSRHTWKATSMGNKASTGMGNKASTHWRLMSASNVLHYYLVQQEPPGPATFFIMANFGPTGVRSRLDTQGPEKIR